MTELYNYKQSASQLMITAFVVGFFAFAYAGWQAVEADRLWYWLGAIIFIFIGWQFSSLRIVLTPEYLRFGFGWMRQTIKVEDLMSVEISQFKWGNYWGLGIRRGRDRTWGYVATTGPGLLLKTTKHKFFISLDNPEQLADLLKNSFIKSK
ncbi:MAG: hypothetical protein ACKKL5_01650 [Candidatus Komeilibacteria bacterium]